MIISHVDHLSSYVGAIPNLKYLIDYFNTVSLKDIEEGSIAIFDDKVFGNCFTYLADGTAGDFFETHCKYLDVHMVLENTENMAVSTTKSTQLTKAYDEEKDIAFYAGDYEQIVRLTPGICLITLPEDLHQPKVRVNDLPVKKVVFKISIN
ncbi:YhcH/YjgK/YiaL family protein [Streptococcus sp. CSL10205-OR2]|uniref:YhcH/YjgK/YiaL family protein n=1 Tax=Streptococcus sp. CSL10205-OR2 TaxID=2980558 RepID=UPI0021D96641|nr:YhcH/YjgK/YiaL family protein [Streptococcus sp. CSL10205-OR2]MCU9533349.1 YhcH/YjgK/YiaL family protein [Streptococcus sp. CSL10205-OR2]